MYFLCSWDTSSYSGTPGFLGYVVETQGGEGYSCRTALPAIEGFRIQTAQCGSGICMLNPFHPLPLVTLMWPLCGPEHCGAHPGGPDTLERRRVRAYPCQEGFGGPLEGLLP